MKILKFISFLLSIPFLVTPLGIALTFPELTQTQVFMHTWWMIVLGIVLLGLSMSIQKTKE